MKKKSKQPDEAELTKIVIAACRAWGSIRDDVLALEGRVSCAGAIELILDCDRILTFGKLDRKVYAKFDAQLESILKKHKARWLY